MATLWSGIDAGKRSQYCVVMDDDGKVLLSTKVNNDEAALLDLITSVLLEAAGRDVCWAVDLTDGGAALLIGMLAAHVQQLLYLPGRIVHHADATYRGDGKTDAKDARSSLIRPAGAPARAREAWSDRAPRQGHAVDIR